MTGSLRHREPGYIDALADAMRRSLDDVGLARRLGQAGHAHAMTRLGADIHDGTLGEILERTMAKHQPKATGVSCKGGDQMCFHFIFGLREQTEAFHLVHYLCLESCRQLHPQAELHFHYRHEPWGPWWERIRSHLRLRPVEGAVAGFDAERYRQSSEGRMIAAAGYSYAHEADFLRLRILLAEGGCYADMDTLFVQPYPERFFQHEFAMGEELPVAGEAGITRPSLCNAVMFAQPGARFVGTWLKNMEEVFDGTWSRHSCFEAARIWENTPEAVHVLPVPYFYRYGWTLRGLHTLFEHLDKEHHSDLYSIHLWAHLWWSEARRDFTSFHAGLITPQFLRSAETTYAYYARRFLPEDT